jgi:Flp pilus assembly protein TadD
LESDILMEEALAAFKDARYAEAERRLESLLAKRPDNLDIKRLLAWSIYHQGRGNDALPLLLSLYQSQEDPAIAETILGVYSASRDRGRAAAFADSLALSDKQEIKKVAGDFFFNNGFPVRAAATYCDPNTCYYNADTPYAELSAYYRQRSGDEGTSG